MAKSSFSFLTPQGRLSPDIARIMSDSSIFNTFSSLPDYFKSEKIKYDPIDLQKFIRQIDKTLYQSVYRFSLLQFRRLEAANNWGEAGEQQVKLSFCRCLMDIKPEEGVTAEHVEKFYTKIDEDMRSFGIDSLTEKSAKLQVFSYQIEFGNEKFSIYDYDKLNDILTFVGSKYRLLTSSMGTKLIVILGKGRFRSSNDYDTFIIQKEVMRSPDVVTSLAAINAGQLVCIRMESIDTIFAQKWQRMFSYDQFELERIKSDPYWNIGEAIKQQVLSLHTIRDQGDLERLRQEIVNDVVESVLYHEIGHKAQGHDVLNREEQSIGEGCRLVEDAITEAMLEFFADFCPKIGKNKGPLQHMVDTNKTDPKKAQRLFFTYMSDTWFYNTDDEFMYTYSDIITLFLCRYLKRGKRIDFELMEKDLVFDISTDLESGQSVFNRLLSMFQKTTIEIKQLVSSAKFSFGTHSIEHPQLKSIVTKNMRQEGNSDPVESYDFLGPFWINMIGYVLNNSDSADRLRSLLDTHKSATVKKVMTFSCGKKIAERYAYDHRKYIVDKLTQVGLRTPSEGR